MKTMQAFHRWSIVSCCASVLIGAESDLTISDAITKGTFGGSARYRLDSVEDATKPETAIASTLRTALSYTTRPRYGVNGSVELYSVNIIGNETYNWLGNENGTDPYYSRYPNINDPENAGFSQLYGQWTTNDSSLMVRVGRQRIMLNDEQWLTASAYRQNQNIVDAAWMKWIPSAKGSIDIGYLWAQRDIVARYFRMNSAVCNFTYQFDGLAKCSAYGLWTDYETVPTNDLQTIGVRAESPMSKDDNWQLIYIADVANQSPQFENTSSANKSSWYALGELGVRRGAWSLRASVTHRDGTGQGHDVIKAPLGYAYPYRGETEQFVTTPVDGVQIYAIRGGGPIPGIDGLRFSLFAWNYCAVESSAHYGTEGCVQLDYVVPQEKRWSWSLRAAHFKDVDADPVANPTYGREQTRLIAMTNFAF
jgi:hypothetical protein